MYTGNPYTMGYNPQLSQQQRLSLMEQQYPQFAQPQQPMQNMPNMPMQQPQMNMGLKGRVVTSLDEARASMIDFDGSVFIFPDISNKKIYTKQINLDGTATLLTYELKNDVPQQPMQSNVVSNTTSQELNELRNEVANLRQELDDLKGGLSNVQSASTNASSKSVKKQSKSNGNDGTDDGK